MSHPVATSVRTRAAALGLTLIALAVLGATMLAGPAGAGTNPTIEKSDSPDPVQVGQALTYTLTVRNTTDIQDVSVEDELPDSVEFISASSPGDPPCERQGRTVTCELGDLEANEPETVEITVRPRRVGQISNTATVFHSGFEDESDTEQTRVTEGPRCGGRDATIGGTAGPDRLIGTPGKDVIAARGGRDVVKGLGGKDRLCGAKGKDKLKGGGGNDKLKGAKGKDRLVGGGGRDKCVGGKGDDIAKKCEVERSI